MPGRYRANWRDYDNKSGTMALDTYSPTAAEWDAFQVSLTAFVDAVVAATVGNTIPAGESWSWSYEAPNKANAASSLAQREQKWLCRYTSATMPELGQFRLEIPTADLTLLTNNSDFLDLSAGAGLAFKNAFEAVVVTPDAYEHATTLLSVQYVGRNL